MIRYVFTGIALVLNIYAILIIFSSLFWEFLNRTATKEYSTLDDINTLCSSIWIIIVLCSFSYFLIKNLKSPTFGVGWRRAKE